MLSRVDFPDPERPDDRHVVAGADLEADAAEDLQPRVVGETHALGDVVEGDESHQLIPLSHCSTPG